MPSPWPGRGRHARFQALLVRSLDEPLAADEVALLAAHLAACPMCRTMAAGYDDDRARLRSLRPIEPPRDLWARTATALDHEVAQRDRRPAVVSLGTLAGLVAVLALLGSQLGPGSTASPTPAATPFAITPQSLAFLTRQGGELALYRTQINEVCPAALLDCPQRGDPAGSFVRMDADLQPSGLAVGADGRVLITGRDADGHAVFGIVHLDETLGGWSDGSGGGPTSTPAATASGMTPAPTTGTATASAPVSPAPPTAGGSAGPSATAPTASAVVPPTPSLPQVRPILSDVIQTGASAAWSPDGSTLAFSAMPADGSRGPDVYVWSPGDDVAVALTHDHRSSFASWVGSSVLVSRAVPARSTARDGRSTPPSGSPAAKATDDATPRSTARSSSGAAAVGTRGPGDGSGPSASESPSAPTGTQSTASPTEGGAGVETLLVDPASGSAELVPGLADAWLPSVDPTGRFVAYWQGTFTWDGANVTPAAGRLWIAPWGALDPTASPVATRRPIPSGSPPARGGGASATSSPNLDATNPAAASATPAAETERWPLDPTAGTVTNWRIRWADDGSAVGLWLAATTTAEVGQLTVLTPPDPLTQETTVLLAPTPAADGAFAMGLDRVAWVVPLGASAGELRVATWGPAGPGGVRLRQLDSSLGVPAF